jgi:hypothetical protein
MNVWLFTRYLLALLLWLPVTPAFAEATSTEIEFWQSVKDSGDAEMLDAYLQEFPDGEFTELANIKIRKLSGATEVNYLWCATKSAVIKQTKASCNQLGGKSFDNKDSALDEKHRRNQVGSQVDLKTTQGSSEVSANDQPLNLANRPWCVTAGGVQKIGYSSCFEKNGIPTRSKTGGLVDRASWYFRDAEEDKALAISNNSVGESGWWSTEVDAVRRALFTCHLRSSAPESCRVINVNGRFEEHSNAQQAADQAFGASGPIADLTGKYYFNMNYQGVDGTLRVKVEGESISATLETCLEGICANWTLQPNPWTASGRRFSGKMKRGARQAGWSAKEVFFRGAFSKDTNRVVGLFGFYEFEGKKRSSAN